MSRGDSFFVNPITYLQNTLSELKQVSWPSRQQTIKLTVIVITISLVVGAYVGLLDMSFTKILSLLIK